MPKFEVITGTPPPDSPAERVRARLRKTATPDVLQCPRCAGREVIELRSGVTMKDGRTSGGYRRLACAACWLKGERIIIA